jgi:hypothetical protein
MRSGWRELVRILGAVEAFDAAATAMLEPNPDLARAAAKAAVGDRQGETDNDQPEVRASPDCCSVHWFGADHVFNKGQAACVRILLNAYQQGTPCIAEETILDAAGLNTPLRSIFRGNPAFGAMIVPAGKGIFRLQRPE